MRPAGPAHTVIVVQSARKKDGETAVKRNRAQADLDHLLRAAHQRSARTGRCGPESRQKGSPGHPVLPCRADVGRHEPWPC